MVTAMETLELGHPVTGGLNTWLMTLLCKKKKIIVANSKEVKAIWSNLIDKSGIIF
jgi:hypothetical protein